MTRAEPFREARSDVSPSSPNETEEHGSDGSSARFDSSGPGGAILREVAHMSFDELSFLDRTGAPAQKADPLVGRRLGQFEVLERIGAGGMGIVYKARHARLRRRIVALKVLPPRYEKSVARRALLEREARNADAVRHPSVAETFDIAEADGVVFVVMEHVDGSPLRELLKSGHGASLSAVLSYASQIAAGLSAAHGVGVVHRDLSPNNVMLTHDGRVKILDFGLSKLIREQGSRALDVCGDAQPSGTATVGPVGTKGYMSPEQRAGGAVDARADIYSFGVLLKEMIAASPLEPADERLRAAAMRIAERCTRKRVEERFTDGTELTEVLRPLVFSRRASRPGLRYLALAAGVFALAAAGALFYDHSRPGEDPYVHLSDRGDTGCAEDGGETLLAAAQMPTPEHPTLRFFLRRPDDSPWTTPGKLTLYVGKGPTCARKPPNVPKATANIVVGNAIQVINLRVKPYDGEWSVGEVKTFWIGMSQDGWESYRTSGPIVVKRVTDDS